MFGTRTGVTAMVLGVACLFLMCGANADVDLSIQTDKQDYVLDEPIFLTATVRNSGDSPVAILRHLHPGAGILSLHITCPGRTARSYGPWTRSAYTRDGLLDAVINLGPDESYSASIDVTYDRNGNRGVLLERPGEYVIQATYMVPDDLPLEAVTARSNEVRFVVREPTGIDAAAYSILRGGHDPP